MLARRMLTPFTSPLHLHTNLARIVPIDASWFMPSSPRKPHTEFLSKRIPGARFFDVDAIADQCSSFPHMLPSPDTFRTSMSRLGIQKSDEVCVYDSVGLFSSARAAWTFHVFGHEGHVSILEGGLPAWEKAGYETETQPLSTTKETEYGECSLDESLVSDFKEIVDIVEKGNAQVIDARPTRRWTGQDPEPRPGLSSGHMPNSISVPFDTLVKDGSLLPTSSLKSIFRDAGIDLAKPIVTSCGSGMTAVIIWLALARLGVKAKVYDESWTGYADESRAGSMPGMILKSKNFGESDRVIHQSANVNAKSLSNNWIVTVGLEIHAQLRTSQKLFSKAPNRFGATVNTDLAPFDVALPGSQPVLNLQAVLLAVRAALAFECKVNPASTFDRKHYFYPDQPGGYQITQHYNALAHAGKFFLHERDGIDQSDSIEIGISQLQLEQDTARTTYLTSPPRTLVDLNRTGAPLIEIVTTPSIPSAKAAGAALRKIQAVLRAVGASDANMESGGMRCDVNVSVTTQADRHLGPSRRVEIKNLASGRTVIDAVEAEFARQVSVLDQGGIVGKETRGYDAQNRCTFLMRSKETTVDYRYMPEPDLGPIWISDEFLRKCAADLPELPDVSLDRLSNPPYSLAIKDAKVLTQDDNLLKYFEDVLDLVGRADQMPSRVANWIVHEMMGRQRLMIEDGREPNSVTTVQMAGLISMIISGKLTRTAGKTVLQSILDGNKAQPDMIVKDLGLLASDDSNELGKVLLYIMKSNSAQTAKLQSGDIKIRRWFVGQAMRATKGRANASEIERIMKLVLGRL